VWEQIEQSLPARSIKPPAAELGFLLATIKTEALRSPTDQTSLCNSLEKLLEFLSDPEYRTDENVRFASEYLAWVGPLSHLPDDHAEILYDISGWMRESVRQPSFAERSGSTPELLLARLRRAVSANSIETN